MYVLFNSSKQGAAREDNFSKIAHTYVNVSSENVYKDTFCQLDLFCTYVSHIQPFICDLSKNLLFSEHFLESKYSYPFPNTLFLLDVFTHVTEHSHLLPDPLVHQPPTEV